MPAATAFTSSDEPPKLRNGSVRPLVGQDGHRDREVHERLHAEHRRDAEREVAAVVVGRAERGAHAARDEQRGTRAQSASDADEAELLADDRGDEVGVRLGQVERLQARARGRARTAPPEPKLMTDWNGWYARSCRCSSMFSHARYALVAVLAASGSSRAAERAAEDRRAEDVADLRARHEEHREREEQEHDRAAEVGLLQAEEHEDAGHEQVREEADGEAS